MKKIKKTLKALGITRASPFGFIDELRYKFFLPQILSRSAPHPLIIGPWLGEVGPEIQYWVPYLNQLSEDGLFKGRQLIVISRGGTSSWYQNLDPKPEYLDIFDLISTDEYKQVRIERQRSEKQLFKSDFEKLIIAKAKTHLRLHQAGWFHPEWMWKDISAWMADAKPFSFACKRLLFKEIPIENATYKKIVDSWNLPPLFICTKFYSSYLFPYKSPAEINFTYQLLKKISAAVPIVDMGLGQNLDDHEQIKLEASSKIIRLSEKLVPRDNLGLQTEVMRRSLAFVGTYGGFTVIPAFLKKPSFGIYSGSLDSFHALHFKHESITKLFYDTLSVPYWVGNISTFNFLDHLISEGSCHKIERTSSDEAPNPVVSI